MPEGVWASVRARRAAARGLRRLPTDLDGSWKRWKEWFDNEQPENEPLPGEWKRLPNFQRLLVIRAMRPDRMVLATKFWVRDEMGMDYYNAVPFDLPASFEDANPGVPVFFLLSPGVDALSDVRLIGKPADKTEANGLFFSVSLGQGQEIVAEKALDRMQVSGGWAMLQNIELCASWLPKLEKKLEGLIEGAHPEFRVFLAALPQNCVPVQILQNSIKLTNEPPSGLRPNMLRVQHLQRDHLGELPEAVRVQGDHLRAVLLPLGGLRAPAVRRDRLEPRVPVHAGRPLRVHHRRVQLPQRRAQGAVGRPALHLRRDHVRRPHHRRLGPPALRGLPGHLRARGAPRRPRLLPQVRGAAATLAYKGYIEYVEETLVNENPQCFSLHANSEINFMTQQADALFKSAAELRRAAAAAVAA